MFILFFWQPRFILIRKISSFPFASVYVRKIEPRHICEIKTVCSAVIFLISFFLTSHPFYPILSSSHSSLFFVSSLFFLICSLRSYLLSVYDLTLPLLIISPNHYHSFSFIHLFLSVSIRSIFFIMKTKLFNP